jgi:hypothetical protein
MAARGGAGAAGGRTMKEKQPSAADVTRVGIRWIALLALLFYMPLNIGQGSQDSIVLKGHFMPQGIQDHTGKICVAHRPKIKGSVNRPSTEDALLPCFGEQWNAGEDGFLQISKGAFVGSFSVFGGFNQISYYFDLRLNPIDGSPFVQESGKPEAQSCGGKPTNRDNKILGCDVTSDEWWKDHTIWYSWYPAVFFAVCIAFLKIRDEISWQWRWNWGPWWKKRFSFANASRQESEGFPARDCSQISRQEKSLTRMDKGSAGDQPAKIQESENPK